MLRKIESRRGQPPSPRKSRSVYIVSYRPPYGFPTAHLDRSSSLGLHHRPHQTIRMSTYVCLPQTLGVFAENQFAQPARLNNRSIENRRRNDIKKQQCPGEDALGGRLSH